MVLNGLIQEPTVRLTPGEPSLNTNNNSFSKRHEVPFPKYARTGVVADI